jgi:hypothetical protein
VSRIAAWPRPRATSCAKAINARAQLVVGDPLRPRAPQSDLAARVGLVDDRGQRGHQLDVAGGLAVEQGDREHGVGSG